MTEQTRTPTVTPTNKIAVSLAYVVFGVATLVVAATGWWDPSMVMGVGLLCAIALLFWQSAAFRRRAAEPAESREARRERLLVATVLHVWVGVVFVWWFGTGQHSEPDGRFLAAAGLTFVAWGCWRLRESLR